MNKRSWYLVSFVLIAAMLLSACSTGAETTTEPTMDVAEPTNTTAMEPTEEMTQEVMEPTEEVMEPTAEMTEEATEPPMAGEIDCMGAQPGDEISMLYQWSGVEEAALNQVLQPLIDACGIVLRPESTRDQALLDTRVQAGTPPDVAFWQVAQLVQYQDILIPMDQLGANRASYQEFFLTPMTVNGNWLGLPIKADVKSIIWYSPANFEALGYTVPTTWEELDALVEQMVTDGQVPWSMGFESGDATGWTGTDFVQDIMLVQQGPEFVQGLLDGSISFDDPGVKQAWETYGMWATDETYTVGGAQGTLSTAFLQAIYKPFGDPPEAMMVKQSGFAGGEIAKQFPDLVQGTDYDFFVMPGIQGLQGSIEPMMAFSDKPAVQALVAYLTSAEGGANWAAATFGLSPNSGASGNYTDAALQKLGEAMATTQGFTTDIGDTIPGGFGSAEFQAITDYVNGGDLDALLADLATRQAEGLSQ
jgi:alpha-glucoside transport system substrate-binding protein